MQNIQHKVCGQPSFLPQSHLRGTFWILLGLWPTTSVPSTNFYWAPTWCEALLAGIRIQENWHFTMQRQTTKTNNLQCAWWWPRMKSVGFWWVGGVVEKDWSRRAFFLDTLRGMWSFPHPDGTHAPSSAESSPLDDEGSLWKAFLIRR